jgi:hypothetical protein
MRRLPGAALTSFALPPAIVCVPFGDMTAYW